MGGGIVTPWGITSPNKGISEHYVSFRFHWELHASCAFGGFKFRRSFTFQREAANPSVCNVIKFLPCYHTTPTKAHIQTVRVGKLRKSYFNRGKHKQNLMLLPCCALPTKELFSDALLPTEKNMMTFIFIITHPLSWGATRLLQHTSQKAPVALRCWHLVLWLPFFIRSAEDRNQKNPISDE